MFNNKNGSDMPIFAKKYKFIGKIAEGNFGIVCIAESLQSGAKVALKIDKKLNQSNQHSLIDEARIISIIQNSVNNQLHVPDLIEHGYLKDSREYLAMQMLGPNVKQLMEFSGTAFSLKTVTNLVFQMLTSL